jgi:hypothetical protein
MRTDPELDDEGVISPSHRAQWPTWLPPPMYPERRHLLGRRFSKAGMQQSAWGSAVETWFSTDVEIKAPVTYAIGVSG